MAQQVAFDNAAAKTETKTHYEANPAIEYSSGKEMMKHGPDALHEEISTKMEAAMGRALPQMEVRFKNLSITAELVVSNDASEELLPTLPNVVLETFSGLSAKRHKETKHILNNVNGVFKPGTMTLVLGQPGSGKSSLMKVLAGRFPLGKNCKLEGEIQYNGADQKEVIKRVPQFASYVTQRDFHLPVLTVKETLEFAHECCGGELSKHAADRYQNGTLKENQEALEAARAWVKHYPDVMIQQLGLENCQDTVVGDAMLRGVSGGERKRVTTGEMQFGNKAVSFMDEISTGLDSAATYDIVKTQRSLAKTFRKTVVISLLQPSPEVFELFDYVLIMNQGRVIYHGPQEQALSHFESLGFICPPERDVADFLLDIGTRQQHKYEKGLPAGSKYPRKVADLAEMYEQSVIHRDMLDEVHGAHDPQLLRDREDFFDNVPEFHQNFLESTMTVARRQMKVASRNIPFLASRAIMCILMGFINGTVFWDIDPKESQVVSGVLFQSALFLGLGQFAQIPIFFSQRDVFYKQRGANFYRTSSYVLAFGVSQLPTAIAETVVFGSMIYWMCGFVANVGSFIIFELILLTMMMAFIATFFFLSCILPNMNVALPVAAVVLTFDILYGGFAISESQIPDALVWIYWIDPIMWTIRALTINQYSSSKFDVPIYDGVDYAGQFNKTMGKYSLEIIGMKTDKYWMWLAFVFNAAMFVLMMAASWFVLEYSRFEQPENSGLIGGDEDDGTRSLSTSPASSTASDYALAATPRGDSNGEIILEVNPSRTRKVASVTLAFKDLWYTVPDPQNPGQSLDLLKGISGYALPGSITALMGSSGAGKTTLMDVIAGRKTGGKIQGQVLLNGHAATPLAIQRSTGYCEQMDIHSDASTFREALTFSAFLRQGMDVPDSEKYDSVEECLDLLDLRPIADKIIRGSSVEQMKRLTIGVELAAQPSVLFLDEPTSGLDARSAKLIMDSVRKVADTGRTVVCTIHQPSAEVFRVFDSLLLLKRGGFTVYFGELGRNASELVNYLQSIEGVAPLKKGYNPATWMLESIGAGVGNAAGQTTDFVEIFNQSAKKAAALEYLDRDGVTRPAPGSSQLVFAKKRAASNSTQAYFLIGRFFNLYWRTASYSLTRFGIFLMLGLIYGVTYTNVEYHTYQGVNGGIAMMFLTTTFLGIVALNTTVPFISEDRGAFYRERAGQTYNAFWYFMGAFLAEMPFVFGPTLIFVAIVFPMVSFEGLPEFVLYWLITSLFVLWLSYSGFFLAFALPSVEVATAMGLLFNSIFILFVGFNPPASAIPHAYKWLYQITPHKYALEGVTSVVFGNCNGDHPSRAACNIVQNVPPTIPGGLTVEEFIDVVYNMSHDHLGRDVAVLAGVAIGFGLLTLLAMRFVNHQTK